jgi:hypothetical protein
MKLSLLALRLLICRLRSIPSVERAPSKGDLRRQRIGVGISFAQRFGGSYGDLRTRPVARECRCSPRLHRWGSAVRTELARKLAHDTVTSPSRRPLLPTGITCLSHSLRGHGRPQRTSCATRTATATTGVWRARVSSPPADMGWTVSPEGSAWGWRRVAAYGRREKKEWPHKN